MCLSKSLRIIHYAVNARRSHFQRDLTFIESYILSCTEDDHDWVPLTKPKVLAETLMNQANKKGFKLIQKKKCKRAAPSCRPAETEPDSKVNLRHYRDV